MDELKSQRRECVWLAVPHLRSLIFCPPTLIPGIMLHFDDALLSDLYFVNPQWLCSLMANVITVQEKNPFQKNGTYNYVKESIVNMTTPTSSTDPMCY